MQTQKQEAENGDVPPAPGGPAQPRPYSRGLAPRSGFQLSSIDCWLPRSRSTCCSQGQADPINPQPQSQQDHNLKVMPPSLRLLHSLQNDLSHLLSVAMKLYFRLNRPTNATDEQLNGRRSGGGGALRRDISPSLSAARPRVPGIPSTAPPSAKGLGAPGPPQPGGNGVGVTHRAGGGRAGLSLPLGALPPHGGLSLPLGDLSPPALPTPGDAPFWGGPLPLPPPGVLCAHTPRLHALTTLSSPPSAQAFRGSPPT